MTLLHRALPLGVRSYFNQRYNSSTFVGHSEIVYYLVVTNVVCNMPRFPTRLYMGKLSIVPISKDKPYALPSYLYNVVSGSAVISEGEYVHVSIHTYIPIGAHRPRNTFASTLLASWFLDLGSILASQLAKASMVSKPYVLGKYSSTLV